MRRDRSCATVGAMDYSEARRRVSAVAEGQRSLITLQQLRACGLSEKAIRVDRRRGHLVPVFRGVDRVGGSGTTPRQILDAALLVLGVPSGAARLTALALHGVLDRPPAVHALLVPYGHSTRLDACRDGGASMDRIRLHRSRTLDGSEIVTVDGTRASDVVRALLESRTAVSPSRWRDLAARAIRANLTTADAVLDRLRALGNITGGAAMRRELADLPAELGRGRSAPETDLPALFLRAGLPAPILNHEIRDGTGVLLAEVDAALPAWKLGYELDSRRWHTLPSQVLNDEVKDLRLGALGWMIHRIPMPLLRQPRYLERLLARTFAAACARSSAPTPGS